MADTEGVLMCAKGARQQDTAMLPSMAAAGVAGPGSRTEAAAVAGDIFAKNQVLTRGFEPFASASFGAVDQNLRG